VHPAERVDRDVPEPEILQLAEQGTKPGICALAELAAEVGAHANQRNLRPPVAAAGVEQVEVGMPPHALAANVQLAVVVAMRPVDRRVELAVPVVADRAGAAPGLAGDRDDLRNRHAVRLRPMSASACSEVLPSAGCPLVVILWQVRISALSGRGLALYAGLPAHHRRGSGLVARRVIVLAQEDLGEGGAGTVDDVRVEAGQVLAEAVAADGEDAVEEGAVRAAALGGQGDGDAAPGLGYQLGGVQQHGEDDVCLDSEVEVAGDDEAGLGSAAG